MKGAAKMYNEEQLEAMKGVPYFKPYTADYETQMERYCMMRMEWALGRGVTLQDVDMQREYVIHIGKEIKLDADFVAQHSEDTFEWYRSKAGTGVDTLPTFKELRA